MSKTGSRHVAVIGVSHPYRGGIANYLTLSCARCASKHRVSFINFSRQYPRLLFPGKTQFDESGNPLLESNERHIEHR